jgi:hypothetical protein
LNDATKLLQAIQPGLALWGVLFTFALVSFRIGKYFWEYDKTLISENVERLKALLEGYRRRAIEPILTREFAAAVSAAYDEAILGLIGDIYSGKDIGPSEQAQGQPARALVRSAVTEEDLRTMIAEGELRKRLESLKRASRSEAFLASPTGEKLYDELDHAYGSRDDLRQHYARARRACGRTAYSFLTLSFVLLAGLLQLLNAWPVVLAVVWATIAAEAFAYGLYSFMRLEWSRRTLLRLWEELQIYGKI